MPLSDCLASRMITGSLAAISAATACAADRRSGAGTVLDVVPPAGLRAAARAVAGEIAAKDPAIIRLAKQSLNGIEPADLKRSYRYEQGFTFELNLTGVSDPARQKFLDGQR